MIEKLSELEMIIRECRELDVAPLPGVRVRLASIGAGNWQNTGGAQVKVRLARHTGATAGGTPAFGKPA